MKRIGLETSTVKTTLGAGTAPLEGGGEVSATQLLADVDPASRHQAQQTIGAAPRPVAAPAACAPAPLRAGMAAGERYTWNEPMLGTPGINHTAAGGGALLAATPGSTIKIYNRMAQGEAGEPALIAETKVHPMAQNADASVPFSGNYNRYHPHGQPRRKPAHHTQWMKDAAAFIGGLEKGEVAVKVPFHGDWTAGDQIMVVSVGPDGTESAPLELTIAKGHPDTPDRVPVLDPQHAVVCDGRITGAAYAATPFAEVQVRVNNGVADRTEADAEGGFSLPMPHAKGEAIELVVGTTRALVAGTPKSDTQRLNRVLNQAMAQLSQRPNADGTLHLSIDGAAAHSTLTVRLPGCQAEYALQADGRGHIAACIEGLEPDANLQVSYTVGDITRQERTDANDALAFPELRALFADESETVIRTAHALFADDGPLARFAGDEAAMTDALHGVALAGLEKGLTSVPGWQPNLAHDHAKRHYHEQDRRRATRHNDSTWKAFEGAVDKAGANEAVKAGFDVGRKQSFAMTTVRQTVVDPGTVKTFVTGGGARGRFGTASAVQGRVWAVDVPGLQPFLFAGATALPNNVNPDAIQIRATLDQNTGRVRIED